MSGRERDAAGPGRAPCGPRLCEPRGQRPGVRGELPGPCWAGGAPLAPGWGRFWQSCCRARGWQARSIVSPTSTASKEASRHAGCRQEFSPAAEQRLCSSAGKVTSQKIYRFLCLWQSKCFGGTGSTAAGVAHPSREQQPRLGSSTPAMASCSRGAAPEAWSPNSFRRWHQEKVFS